MGIAKFEKVTFEQFKKDWLNHFPEDENKVQEIYDSIKLPKRATMGSAGYDFYAPKEIQIEPGAISLIPTGIRAKIDNGYVLMLFPRSSLGFRYRMQLNNTVGIIDSDYYGTANEGHIMCKVTNDTHEGKLLSIEAGQGMVQGIFLPFGLTEDDDTETVRIGGIGSTTK